MTTAFATTADFAASRPASRGVLARVLAAAAAAMARAKARDEYRWLLARDDMLSDVGVSRDDVRQALMANGGRL